MTRDEIIEILKESPLFKYLPPNEVEELIDYIHNKLLYDPLDVVPHIVQELSA